MSTPKKSLVTWGKHPAHGSLYLKLRSGYSRAYNEQRVRQGWSLAFLPRGETPNGNPEFAG